MKFDGTPECVPFFPHEFIQRESSLGRLDYSSFPVKNTTMLDLDTIEIQRLRQFIERNSKEQYLVSLNDEELLKALELIKEHDQVLKPTLSGLLLVGKEDSIHEFIPSHEVSFQVLKGMNVKSNEFFRCSLIKLIDRIETLFMSQIVEDEMQIGMFRHSIPNYDFRAFREAFINALVHRDYTKMGTVAIQIDDLGLSISNPGGFMEGVTLQNILRVQPIPRNRSLADAVKRIGLAERTGRGIDLIYYGLLKNGRSSPDYSDTTDNHVVIHLSNQNPDFSFIELIHHAEKILKQSLPLDFLIIIHAIYQQKKIGINDLSEAIQRNEAQTKLIIDSLLEKELLEEIGSKRNQLYCLSKGLLGESSKRLPFTKQMKSDKKQYETEIFRFLADKNSKLTKAQVIDFCKISSDQAGYLLKKMVQDKALKLIQKGPKSYYIKTE